MKPEIQYLLVGWVIGTAPFYLTASNLTDLSEIKTTATGATLLAILGAVKMIFGKGDK